MIRFTIKIVSIIEDGVFGVLLDEDIPFAVTLWRTYSAEENPQKAVKIQPGTYRCSRTTYHRGGYETFEIHVPEHNRILFHIGNTEDDSDGCCLVGEEFGQLEGKTAILSSGRGFGEFMKRAGILGSFDLEVTK